MNEIGKRITKRCEELKISVPDLANMAGINYKTLNNNINKKDPNPTLDILKRVSITLGTGIDYLVFGEESEEENLKYILNELKTVSKEDKKRIVYMMRMMIAESKGKEI